MYVPENYLIRERGDNSKKARTSSPKEPKLYYPYLLGITTNLLSLIAISLSTINMQQLENNLKSMGLKEHLNLLNDEVRNKFFTGQYYPMIYSIIQGIANQMAYIKLFDATLPDDHPDNYYMEREWRSLDNICFSVEDIRTIY